MKLGCCHLHSAVTSLTRSPLTSRIQSTSKWMTCHYKRVVSIHRCLCLVRTLSLLKIWPCRAHLSTRRAPHFQIQKSQEQSMGRKMTWKTIIINNCVWQTSTWSGGRKSPTRKKVSTTIKLNGRKMSLSCVRALTDSDLSPTELSFASLFKSDWRGRLSCSGSGLTDNHRSRCFRRSTQRQYIAKPSLSLRSSTN